MVLQGDYSVAYLSCFMPYLLGSYVLYDDDLRENKHPGAGLKRGRLNVAPFGIPAGKRQGTASLRSAHASSKRDTAVCAVC